MKAIELRRLFICTAILLIAHFTFSQGVSFSYIYPVAGAKNFNPEQNIILKYPAGMDPGSVSAEKILIYGSESGPAECTYIISKDQSTVIFKPLNPFYPGERVHVSYPGGIATSQGDILKGFEFDFYIIGHDRDVINARLRDLDCGYEDQVQQMPQHRAHLVPQKDNNLPPDYPPPTVYAYAEHDDSYFFMNLMCRNASLPWKKYITIIDSYGTPIFYDKSNLNRHNFSMLPDGSLCYSISTSPNSSREKYFIMDSAYVVVDSVNTGNGYILDSHDMLLLNNGHYLVMSYDSQPVDMSLVVPGGDPEAVVTGLVIQEVDNEENVFFQWRSWDHFEITDATDDINLLAQNIDYVHGNAFEIDHDGHILLSSRHLDEITKINFNTGSIIWRFGLNSKNNMFQIYNDPIGFSHQHDIRRLPNGHYTIYDNGNLHDPPISQALEYAIDQDNLIATLSWDFQHPNQIYASATGSFRTLANERVIGWGATFPIAATVLDDNNDFLQQIYLPDYVNSYRVLKYPWKTSAFETQDILSLGNYSGYSGWKENKLYIFNTSSQVVSITSIHHHLSEFEILTEFPVSIFPGSYKSIDIGFDPATSGEFADRFTLNFDNADNTRRIARQLQVQGYYDEQIPSVFFNPAHGTSNVNPGTEIIINFDVPVRKTFGGDIQNEDIPNLFDFKETFFNGSEISFSGTINEEKTQITIVPDEMLMENQQYYIELKHNLIASYEGNIIKLDEECYFTTGISTSIPGLSNDKITVSPNPFNDMLFIRCTGKSEKNIRIYNAAGQSVIDRLTNNSQMDINMSNHPPGVYYIRIFDQESGAYKVFKTIKH